MRARSGPTHEWRVDLRKPFGGKGMREVASRVKKPLSNQPVTAEEATLSVVRVPTMHRGTGTQ